MSMDVFKNLMSDAKFYMDYSRWMEEENRYESWHDSVERIMSMHRQKYASVMTDELTQLIDFAEQAYKDKLLLGSQRALQFGGDQIFKHEVRLYNCAYSQVDRPEFFQHAMYILLAGCGVGFSVQHHHIEKLPAIKKPDVEQSKVFIVPDSIEGWADAFGVLLSSYMVTGGSFPEYKGKVVHFDVSKIRPRGSLISGGFKAPGPDGLVKSLEFCRKLLDKVVAEALAPVKLKAINIYDFIMHMADAVLSGGIRRAATICIFSKDDQEMLTAKTGNWLIDNPQRGRSNNSALLIRDDVTKEEWDNIIESVKEFGEPGFIFSDDSEFGYNPCVEIGLRGYTEDGRSGFQFCNLCDINGSQCTSKEELFRAAKAGAILGTLQAGYTNFTYLDQATRDITEREALLGVGITGWMSNPDILFNEENILQAAKIAVETNELVAPMLNINKSARVTTVKPSGNASVLLGTSSGIHGEHAPRYFRNIQMSNQEEVAIKIKEINPKMVEKSVWSQSGEDYVVSFPIVSNENALFKRDLLGTKQLEYVKHVQQTWIKAGKVEERCIDKRLTHNVSNTITVDDWDEVSQYIFDNKEHFAGISLMPKAGDRAYPQAPFTEVYTPEQIQEMYGVASMFASGLIVDANHAFNNNLFTACDTVLGHGVKLEEDNSQHLLMRDWVRRAKKFAKTYFDNDNVKMTNCLKDVNNLHRWESIVRNYKPINYSTELEKQKYTDVDTMGAMSCHGGACDIV